MIKTAGRSSVKNEMIKTSGGFDTRWMTEQNFQIKLYSKRLEKTYMLPVCKEKGDPLVYGSYRAIKLMEQHIRSLSVRKEHQMLVCHKVYACQCLVSVGALHRKNINFSCAS